MSVGISFLEKDKYIFIDASGNLPHWFQSGKTQFVTFRQNDSLPQKVILEIKRQIENFKSTHPEPWDDDTKHEYNRVVGTRYEKYLDCGYGSCLMSSPDIRDILESALRFKNGRDYCLHAYVIMPNHVHLLITPANDKNIEQIVSNIKRYTARKINEMRRCEGSLWMRESFDVILRSQNHFAHCLEYIKQNPRHLPPGTYSLWIDGQ